MMMEEGVERRRVTGECVWAELKEVKKRSVRVCLSDTQTACERQNGCLERERVPALRASLLQASEGLAKQATLSSTMQEW